MTSLAADIPPAGLDRGFRARPVVPPPGAGAGPAGPAGDAGDAPERGSFADRMRRALVDRPAAATAAASEDPRGAARTAAEQMVASLFVQPMLDMALESRMQAGGPFAPGEAEKSFGPLLNQRLADQIVRAADLPLVDVLVDRLAGPAPAATGATADTGRGAATATSGSGAGDAGIAALPERRDA